MAARISGSTQNAFGTPSRSWMRSRPRPSAPLSPTASLEAGATGAGRRARVRLAPRQPARDDLLGRLACRREDQRHRGQSRDGSGREEVATSTGEDQDGRGERAMERREELDPLRQDEPDRERGEDE